MTDLSQTAEFARLQKVVTQACVRIAYFAYIDSKEYYHLYERVELTDEQRERAIEHIVDKQVSTAFNTITLCMPEFASLSDTVTRSCARSAIHEVVALCYERDIKFGPAHDLISENIDLESVWDDVLAMNEDDEDE